MTAGGAPVGLTQWGTRFEVRRRELYVSLWQSRSRPRSRSRQCEDSERARWGRRHRCTVEAPSFGIFFFERTEFSSQAGRLAGGCMVKAATRRSGAADQQRLEAETRAVRAPHLVAPNAKLRTPPMQWPPGSPAPPSRTCVLSRLACAISGMRAARSSLSRVGKMAFIWCGLVRR